MEEIIKILQVNNNSIEFDSSLTVKMSPHQAPEKIKCVYLDSDESLYFINKEGFHIIATATPVINSILQRLKLMKYEGKIN